MGEGVAAVEGVAADRGEATRQGDPGQKGAGDECIVADGGDAVRQGDRDESVTGVEGVVIDGGLAVGHVDVAVRVGRVPTDCRHATEQCEKEQRRSTHDGSRRVLPEHPHVVTLRGWYSVSDPVLRKQQLRLRNFTCNCRHQ